MYLTKTIKPQIPSLRAFIGLAANHRAGALGEGYGTYPYVYGEIGLWFWHFSSRQDYSGVKTVKEHCPPLHAGDSSIIERQR